MQAIGLVLALTVMTEGIVEYFGKKVPRRKKPYAAALLSIALCVVYNADLLALLGYTALMPYIGAVLTGLVISRGSNYVNDLVSRLNIVRTPAARVNQVQQQGVSPKADASSKAAPSVTPGTPAAVSQP